MSGVVEVSNNPCTDAQISVSIRQTSTLLTGQLRQINALMEYFLHAIM